MVAYGMRYIVRFREWRDCDQGNANTELVEVRAFRRVRARGIGRHCRAELDCVFYAGVGRAQGVAGALRAASWLLAGRRIRQIGALTGCDSVRSEPMILRRGRRRGVIVEPAVLIIGKKDDRVFPVRTVANGVNYLRDVGLPALNVGRRMLIVFARRSGQAKIGVDKRNRRQRSCRSRGQKG